VNVYEILVIISALIMLSYFLDLVAHKINFPSVLLLIGTGIIIKQISVSWGLAVYDFNPIIPILGTIGLILIVFEGALDLDISRKKLRLISWAFLAALGVLVFTNVVIAIIFQIVTIQSFYQCLLNALPFSVISSAIAIPSVTKLKSESKEFIIFESSFSDILGIVFFTFFITNNHIDFGSVLTLGKDMFLLGILAIVSSLILAFILSRLKHSVKFFLIIAILIFVFSLGKIFHLSTLLIILVFGLMLSNLNKFNFGPLNKYLKYDKYEEDFKNMHMITYESTFLVKTFFFIIFGYIINLNELLDWTVIKNGSLIFFGILFCRFIFLYVFSRKQLFPELFISPRGLITILLYFMLPDELKLPEVNMALLMFVILSTNVTMLIGIFAGAKAPIEEFDSVLINESFETGWGEDEDLTQIEDQVDIE
jgi:NhaP-type Na+/H+ and K+/H+ antiporter